ncbi:TPA: hypothetical protein HA225_01700 [Candidatus Micrarchaeota archaeon]|nr:hypothetical protein [Candidatus Micrarchaeota archaeon]HIH29792.1 hypothetical protein [Candidatus Micrarchaeota archaeon]
MDYKTIVVALLAFSLLALGCAGRGQAQNPQQPSGAVTSGATLEGISESDLLIMEEADTAAQIDELPLAEID